MINQLSLTHLTASSLAVFLHTAEIADGEAHPDTLDFLKSRLQLLFGQSIELNFGNGLGEIEEIVAHLLAVDLFLQNRREFECSLFVEKITEHIKEFMKESQKIANENQSFMPALDTFSASKPLFILINKLLECAANKLITGKITAQELKQIIGITGLVSNALHDQCFEYLEAPESHHI